MLPPFITTAALQRISLIFIGFRSPTDPTLTFQREGFGRQSMSEKRKGHLDPRASEVYQRAKASKDHKEKGMSVCLTVQSSK